MALESTPPPAAGDDDAGLIPLIVPSYVERVRRLVAKFAARVAADDTDYFAWACLRGWEAELKRLERGEIY